MTDFEQLIDDLMEGLQREAQDVAAEYWNQRAAENEKRPAKERSYLGVRATVKGGAVRIEWFKSKPVKRDDSDPRTYSTHIRKGRQGNRYPDHVLRRHAQQWQIEMVRYCEERFAEIRQTASELVELRTRAKRLRKRRGLRFESIVQNELQQIVDKESA